MSGNLFEAHKEAYTMPQDTIRRLKSRLAAVEDENARLRKELLLTQEELMRWQDDAGNERA